MAVFFLSSSVIHLPRFNLPNAQLYHPQNQPIMIQIINPTHNPSAHNCIAINDEIKPPPVKPFRSALASNQKRQKECRPASAVASGQSEAPLRKRGC